MSPQSPLNPSECVPAIVATLTRTGQPMCVACLALDSGLPLPDITRCFQHGLLSGVVFKHAGCGVCQTERWCASFARNPNAGV